MAFTFPNPDTTSEFTGANGITYRWDATDGKWIIKGFVADEDGFYQSDPPTLVENPNLASGDLWVSSESFLLYVWNGNDWVEVGSRCGDKIETTGASFEDFPSNPSEEGFIHFNTATDTYYQYNNGVWHVMCFGQQNCEPTGSWENQGEKSSNTVPPTGISLYWRWIAPDSTDLYAPHNTSKLMLIEAARPSIDSFEAEPTHIYINGTFFVIRKLDKNSGKYNSIYLHGDQRDFLNNNNTLNYRFCGEDDFVPRDEFEADQKRQYDLITELEEEIDALAPAVERGVWTFNSIGIVSDQGRISMYDDDYSGVGSPTDFFQSAKSIWLNQKDNDGTVHGFGNVVQGKLIELFVEGKPDYGLYEVVADPHEETNSVTTWWVIEVQCLRALSDTSMAEPLDNIRVKIFEAPSGGTADDFIRSGGTTELQSSVIVKAPTGTDYNFAVYGADSPTAFYVRDKNDTTHFRVGNNGQVQAGPDETNPFIAIDNHDLTTKKYVEDYVDDKLDDLGLNADSECININGGKLCAGGPHPKFIDALNSSAIKYNTLNQLTTHTDNNWRYLRTFDDDNEMYRVLYSTNNRNKAVYRVNYVNNTATFVRNFYDYNFYNNDYRQVTDVIMGTVSHDKKYAIAGSQWGGYGGGNDSRKFQYVYEIDLTNTNTSSTTAVQVASGYSSYYKAHSVTCTGPKPDSPSGYMIGAFYHSGSQGGTYYYDHTVVVYKFGAGNGNVKTFYTSSKSYWDHSAAPNLYRGNPDHEEFLVTSSTSLKKTIYKVTFSGGVNNTTLQELISASKLPDGILSITYLPRSKRYYLGGYNRGYLTRPYDGPLDDTCFDDAIIVDIPKYTVQWKGATSDFKRYYYYNQPFEFNNEIVLIGANARSQLTSPDDGTKAYLRAPQPIMIYDGGDQWKIYESTAPPSDSNHALDENAAAWNDVERDFPWEKRFDDNYIKRNKVVDSPSQHYGTESIRLQEDVVIETPGFPQPYTQPLYWNGAQIN